MNKPSRSNLKQLRDLAGKIVGESFRRQGFASAELVTRWSEIAGADIAALSEPVKIQYLAEQMIRLANKIPNRDILIVYSGLRPGEKLFEELFHPQENYQDTRHAKIFLAQPRSMSWELLNAQLRNGAQGVRDYDEDVLRRCMSSLLPEFALRDEQAGDVVSINRRNKEIS